MAPIKVDILLHEGEEVRQILLLYLNENKLALERGQLLLHYLNENMFNLGISLFEGLGQELLHRGVGSPELVQLVGGDQPDEDDHDNDDGVDDDDDDQPGAVVEEQLDGDEGKWEGDDQGGE